MISKGKKLRAKFKLTIVQDGAVREVVFADLLTRRTIVWNFSSVMPSPCNAATNSGRPVSDSSASTAFTPPSRLPS